MRAVARPTISAKDSYRVCSAEADDPVRTTLAGLAFRAVKAAAEFADAALQGNVSSLDGRNFSVLSGTDIHLRENYSHRMVKRARGRVIYDQIRMSSDYCVQCGARQASTLDHYLPKSRFPLLAVAPDNLLPTCYECNQAKADYVPGPTQAALMNPYFDSFIDDLWLIAQVSEATRSVVFRADPPRDWPLDQRERLDAHFERLALGKVYAVMAATIIASLRGVSSSLDRPTRQKFLEVMALSTVSGLGQNHWQSATVRALAESEWYLSGGYLEMS